MGIDGSGFVTGYGELRNFSHGMINDC